MNSSYFRRRLRLLRRAFRKPVGITEVRDQIAYQALWTSRFSALIALIAVLLSTVVAIVAIGSLQLNVVSTDQARLTAQAQITANQQLADAAARQAEASIAAAKTSQENLIASQRAWVGPTDANLTGLEVFKPLQATIVYGNSGRQPAPTFSLMVPRIFTLVEWDNGTAASDIEKWKADCLQLPMNDQNARVTFPTTGFTNFNLKYTGTQKSLRDVGQLSVTPAILAGTEIVAVKGCFVYRTSGQVHRTSYCYFYQAKFSDATHLNFCTVGQAAD